MFCFVFPRIRPPFDITANDKDRVGVDVARNQESINTGKSGSKSDMIDHIAQ